MKTVCIMPSEFYLHTDILFVRIGIIYGNKTHSPSVIYVGKLPIRPWFLVCYLLFCQWIFFESLTWLKAYTALSWFDGFYSATRKTVSLCVLVCMCALQVWIVCSQLKCIF